MPVATIGTPVMRRLRTAATTSSPYEITQSTLASCIGRAPGSGPDGERDELQSDRGEEEPGRPELDPCEMAEPSAEDEPQRDSSEHGERERHDPRLGDLSIEKDDLADLERRDEPDVLEVCREGCDDGRVELDAGLTV